MAALALVIFFFSIRPLLDAIRKDASSVHSETDRDERDAAIRSSIQHAAELFRLAAEASANGTLIYGTLSRPLLGFLMPKAGSNTVAHYLKTALETKNMGFNAGCSVLLPNSTRYKCMLASHNIAETSCGQAFANHFNPQQLAATLIAAERSEHAKCTRWPGLDLSVSGDGLYRTVLRRTVCTVMVRDPVTRAIGAYYEWTYKKRSNLTAIEYLEHHGPLSYSKLTELQSRFANSVSLESCLVGVTERMGEFVTTLSRVLRIEDPQGGSVEKRRSHPHVGVQAADVDVFYTKLTPFFGDEIETWKLASDIAQAQYNLALSFDPVAKIGQGLESSSARFSCVSPCDKKFNSEAVTQRRWYTSVAANSPDSCCRQR